MNNQEIYNHIKMLHDAAKGIEGKLVLASYGQNPISGKDILPKVMHFKIGDVDGMTKAAFILANEPHRNVYAPLAVMRSDLPAPNKGSENDVVAVLGYVADFDNGLGANYEERCPLKPSYALETSPNNIQAGFILEKPLLIKTDADRVFAKQLATKLTNACNGADKCGADISHIWRIAGLPNHPNKKKLDAGRSPEPFQVRVEQACNAHNVSLSELAVLPSATAPESQHNKSTEVEYTKPVKINELQQSGHFDLADSITEKYEGDKSELAASVASKLSQLGHGTGDIIDCFYQNPKGIGERYKGDKDRIEDDIIRMATKWLDNGAASKSDLSFTLEKLEPINEYEIPTREWVLGSHLLKGKVSVCIAPPGVGKSTLSLSMGVSIATNKSLIGLHVHRQGAVAFINNEDDKEEMQRRIAALMKFHGIDYSEIDDKFFLQSGDVMQLCIAKRDPVSKTVTAHHKQALIDFCIEKNIEVLFVDPFLETHEADENDNRQISEVAKMYREVAQKANCAVCLIHHTRKEQGNSSKGHAGNMDSGRGASSLVGAARIVFTLYNMDETAAKKYGIAEDEKHLYVRLDEAKGNMSLISNQAKWFIRESVTLENGESVGVLSPAENMNSVFKDQNLSHEQELIAAILNDEAFEEILEKGTSSRAGFATAMLNAGACLGSKTTYRSAVEKQMDKHLFGKGIKHNGCAVHMTVQKVGEQSRYTVHIELDEQPDATLPPIPEKLSGILENTGLTH